MTRRVRSAAIRFGAVLIAGLLAAGAAAQAPVPPDRAPEIEGLETEQRLGEMIPQAVELVDDFGRTVALSEYFGRGRPVLFTFNYYRCPMLCTFQLDGLVEALKENGMLPGRDFELVTVSFDPLEKPELARTKKRGYVDLLGRPEAAKGWHFMTGRKAAIEALTSAVGFKFRWNAEQQEWAHSATLVICTPDGRISRYLGGTYFEAPDLRRSVVEASGGKIGTLWDQVFFTCFRWDSHAGKYTLHALGLMRVGGITALVVLTSVIATLWRREAARRRAALPGLTHG